MIYSAQMRRCSWAVWVVALGACDGNAFEGDTFVHVSIFGVGTVHGDSGDSSSTIVCSDRSREMCTGDFENATDVALSALADVSGHQFRIWDNLLIEEGSEAFDVPLLCPIAGTTDADATFTTGNAGARYGCLAVFGDLGVPPPVISHVTPSYGQVGDSFQIFGTDLTSPLVRIGSFEGAVVAQPASSSTSTIISTAVPDGAQSGRVTVITPGGVTVSPQDFIVTTEPGSGDCDIGVASSTVSPNPAAVPSNDTVDRTLTVTVPVTNNGNDSFDVTGGTVQLFGGGTCQLASTTGNITAKPVAGGATTNVALSVIATITTPATTPGSCSWTATITLHTTCGDRYTSLATPFVANY